MSFTVVEFSFLTPEEFGADYPLLCAAAGLEPTAGGYGLIHMLDEDGDRVSAISTDVGYVRGLVSDLNSFEGGVEIAADRFSDQRAGWPDDWLAATGAPESAPAVCAECAGTRVVRVPGGAGPDSGDWPAPEARCLDCGHQWRPDPAMIDHLGIDPDHVAAWISDQLEVDRSVVEAVLGLEEEFQLAVGIIEPGPDTTFEHYDPEVLRDGPREIDGDQLAEDAERFLGVPSEVAGDVLDAEMDYFVEVGLVDATEWADGNEGTGLPSIELVWSIVTPALGGDPLLVVLPRDLVDHWMDRLAVLDCTTWGELRATATPEVLDEILGLCGYGTYEQYTANLDITGLAPLPGADALAAEAYARAGDPPADDAPFSPNDIPAYCDGDWPPSVGYLTATVLPDELLDQFAERGMTAFNGPLAEIPATNAEAVLAAFAEHGFELTEYPDLELLVDLRA